MGQQLIGSVQPGQSSSPNMVRRRPQAPRCARTTCPSPTCCSVAHCWQKRQLSPLMVTNSALWCWTQILHLV
jgi:hypothetical protein